MRASLALVLVTILAACGSGNGMGGGGGGGGDSGVTGDSLAFEATSPDITLTPGQEVTYCYYFHTSNTQPAPVDKWESDMTPGSHHLILFIGGASHADGLDMTNSCGLGTSASGTNPPIWVYASQVPQQTEQIPADDGNGKPLAQMIQPNSEAAIQMHYLNVSDQTITAHVHVAAYALPATTTFTETDAYITYNQDIAIPGGATNYPVSASCNLPQGVKFWTMSTHSHKQSVHTIVKDGTSTVFESTDWEHPGQQLWSTSPFYTFSQPQLTWECDYTNPGSTTIVAGASAVKNEMCMAVGYFFPATGPYFGFNFKNQQGVDQCISGSF